jgi:hypothetical protein
MVPVSFQHGPIIEKSLPKGNQPALEMLATGGCGVFFCLRRPLFLIKTGFLHALLVQ